MITNTEKHARYLTVLLILFVFPFCATLAWAEQKLPSPQGLINDFAGIISPSYERKMNLLARDILQKTGNLMVFADIL